MQPTFELFSTAWPSRRHAVRRDGHEVAHFTLRSLRDSGEVHIDGAPYELQCTGGQERPIESYTLSRSGVRVVRASRSSAPGHAFEIQFDDRVVTLIRQGRRCDLVARGQRIGTISRRHVFARRAGILLPADLGLPVVVFVAMLAAMLRGRPSPRGSDPVSDAIDVINLFD